MSVSSPGNGPSADRILRLPQGGSTALRIIVGGQLRRLREAKNITREEAGRAIRASQAKISRLELGKVTFKERDVADLLLLYGVTDDDRRAALQSLARKANTPGWWHNYGDILPSWFELYVGLEEAASFIRTYEIQLVPSLLQTEDYARTVIALGHPGASDGELERRVALRMRRQRILIRQEPSPPQLWAIVDEAALRRPLGNPAMMRAQLEHLLKMINLPSLTLQIASLRHGGHAAEGGSFTILRFTEPTLPDVVYIEQLTGALYLDKPSEVDHYMAVMDRLCVQADPRGATAQFLDKIRRDI